MNLRDALIANHGTDRLSNEADRRLRRRLGLEAGATRRAWLVPAFAFAAVAAVALLVVWQTRPTSTTTTAVATTTQPDPFEGLGVAITSTPGTKLTRRNNDLVLDHGEIQIARKSDKPLAVVVPMGRVVLAAYRSSITVDRESMTILLDDGTGEFIDASGQTHPIAARVPLTLPPSAPPPPVEEVPAPAPAPRPVRPPQGPPSTMPPQPAGPPGLTPTIVRPDRECTYKSDCDPGATCRKNESGISVCMGNGGEGAACWFHNDCTSNLCVSRRCAP